MTGRMIRHWKLALLWVLSLIAAGVISSSAQVRPGLPQFLELPTVVSGDDVGFRIERTQDGIPIGTIVVRVNGRWMAAAPVSQ